MRKILVALVTVLLVAVPASAQQSLMNSTSQHRQTTIASLMKAALRRSERHYGKLTGCRTVQIKQQMKSRPDWAGSSASGPCLISVGLGVTGAYQVAETFPETCEVISIAYAYLASKTADKGMIPECGRVSIFWFNGHRLWVWVQQHNTSSTTQAGAVNWNNPYQ